MRCTKVEVEFSRTVQPAQYESKSAKASISYVPENEDEVIDEEEALRVAFELAKDHVLRQVGLIPPLARTRQEKAAVTRAATKITKEKNEAKAQKAADTRALNKAKAQQAAASVVDEDPTPLAAVSAADIVDDDTGPEVISDGDLIKAVSAKVAELQEAGVNGASDILKKNIASFNPTPGTPFNLANIPPEKRQAFLDQVKLLGSDTAIGMEDF